MRCLVCVTALLLLSLHANAAQIANARSGDKKAWEWRDDERLAERTDVVKAAARVQEFQDLADHGRVTANSAAYVPGDVIDGKRRPELFMPIELFRLFVNGAFVADAQGRRIYREARKQLSTQPLPDNFWSELEGITRSYIRGARSVRQINHAIGVAMNNADRMRLQAEAEALNPKLCRTLSDALLESENTFGRLWFRHFLYESVAPTAMITLASPSTPQELEYVSGGCR